MIDKEPVVFTAPTFNGDGLRFTHAVVGGRVFKFEGDKMVEIDPDAPDSPDEDLIENLNARIRGILATPQEIFTRDDVNLLEDAIYQIHGPKMDALHPGIEQALDNLKDRIEAMLPPKAE